MIRVLLIAFAAVLTFESCESSQAAEVHSATPLPGDFKSYWYNGDAEITSYLLTQARYGELHEGEAVMVFVTEPFNLTKQVKSDVNDGDQIQSSMKLNFTKKFFTGIYPYSMMTSVFTPLDDGNAEKSIKTTTTSQEWCGHTFTQLNLIDDEYNVMAYSYFELEGDKTFRLPGALLEDEIWTRIRSNPKELPVGEIAIIPGSQFQRLSHEEFKVRKAVAEISWGDERSIYTITYPYNDRQLLITFGTEFPHRINGWTEHHASGFGPDRKMMTTTAVVNKSVKVDYWTKNGADDVIWREKLGL